MPKKKHKPEEIVAKLRQADVLISQGQDIADVIRQIGVSEVTYYRWRQDFGGLKTEQVKRLKDLETENTRLRRPAHLACGRLVITALQMGYLSGAVIHFSIAKARARKDSAATTAAAQSAPFYLTQVLGSRAAAERAELALHPKCARFGRRHHRSPHVA